MGEPGYIYYIHQQVYNNYIPNTTDARRLNWMCRHGEAANQDNTVGPAAATLPEDTLIAIHRAVDQ